MFDRYDEIYMIFDNYLLKKVISKNFEIRGTVKILKSIIEDRYKIELPIIMDNDRQLIYSAIINYIDVRNQNEMIYRTYYSKRNTTINKEDASLKELERELNIKGIECIKAKNALKEACQRYAKAICIAIYDGEITLELLSELRKMGYDGSYGSSHLILVFNLYNSNYNNELKLNEIIKANQELIIELNRNITEKQDAKLEAEKLRREKISLQDELNRANTLVDTYKSRLRQEKVYIKKP